MSVHLRTKWLWVQAPLQSLKHTSYNIKMKLKTYCLACRKHTNNSDSKKVIKTNAVIELNQDVLFAIIKVRIVKTKT